VLRVFCVFCTLLSLVIVWSELIFFLPFCQVDLSLFSLYIRALRGQSELVLQTAIFIPVVYIAWCSYSSLFRMRLFNYYHLVPHRSSDSNSLLFSAS
jgi:hypothetical protein